MGDEIELCRHEDQVWDVERGVSTPLGEGPEVGLCPSPEKNFDFRSQMDEFCCKLGGFCTVHLYLV